ncbi:hypothetical protein ACWCQK_41685 [Streptomyces sp. NPDC002306]
MSAPRPTRPECPGPREARALALVDDFGQLSPILLEWRQTYGDQLTGWAMQVDADDIRALPPEVTGTWGPDGIQLDTMPGGCVRVSDYRDPPAPAATTARTTMLMRGVLRLGLNELGE